MLITQPVDIPIPEDVNTDKELANALQWVAIKNELLDVRENWYFSDYNPVEDSIRMLQTRYNDSKDYPKVEDAWRFPPPEVSSELARFNRAYYSYLEKRIPWERDREDLIRVVMSECDQCYRIWDKVRDARCEYCYVFTRREALAYLKKELGEDYETGNLPPHVPHWRFVPLR